jgi:hypothetical protein
MAGIDDNLGTAGGVWFFQSRSMNFSLAAGWQFANYEPGSVRLTADHPAKRSAPVSRGVSLSASLSRLGD